MTCSECKDLVSEYLEGSLHGASKSEFQSHTKSCPQCARTLQQVRVLKQRLAGLPKRHVSDALGFRVRRMLVEEFDREVSWAGRLQSILRPTPQTAWAAASGTLAAVASVAILWAVWVPSQPSVMPPVTASSEVSAEARAVRYVLERFPSGGNLIESIATADTTRRMTKQRSLPGVRTVSADF